MGWEHSRWYVSLEEPSFTLQMKICLMLTRFEAFIYSQHTEAGIRLEGLWWFYLQTILPDACYLWQHLLWLGSFPLSWLHTWHVWNDTTAATALKSSCPHVMQNPCPSCQPYQSAGFNQSGAHLMQSLSSDSVGVSDKWSKHAVTKHVRGSPAPLSLQWVSLQHSFLLHSKIWNSSLGLYPFTPGQHLCVTLDPCEGVAPLEAADWRALLVFSAHCIKIFLKKISSNLGFF